MELEALLLGIEPLTALAVGVGAVILVPVVDAVSSAVGQESKLGESISESARELTKNSLVLGFEVFENLQTVVAQAEESFRDLVAEAKIEHMIKKSRYEKVEPRTIEIVAD